MGIGDKDYLSDLFYKNEEDSFLDFVGRYIHEPSAKDEPHHPGARRAGRGIATCRKDGAQSPIPINI